MSDADKNKRFAEVYANLRTRFTDRTHQQRVRLEELRRALRENPQGEGLLFEVERLCHTLHGSAGTFGFRELGVLSGQVEQMARRLAKTEAAEEQAIQASWDDLDSAILRLTEVLEQL